MAGASGPQSAMLYFEHELLTCLPQRRVARFACQVVDSRRWLRSAHETLVRSLRSLPPRWIVENGGVGHDDALWRRSINEPFGHLLHRVIVTQLGDDLVK